jgi:putative ABC transport system permease protein
MKSMAFAVRSMSRDFKAGELTVLLTAVVVAVTSMTAVGFFTDRVGRAVEAQAAETLAADIVIRSPAAIDAKFLQQGEANSLVTAEAFDFPTVAQSDTGRSLSIVNAVGPNYPLRGKVKISDELFGDGYVTEAIPEPGTAWAEPGLMARLDVEAGASIRLGAAEFKLTKVLDFRPDQGIGFTAMAPSILVNIIDVPAMDVVKTGSRVTYRQLFAGEPGDLNKFIKQIKPELSDEERVSTIDDTGEQISAAIDRARRFLTLASLVTVILAAIATAMASRRYALRHLDTVALLKSLGAKQNFIQNITVLQLIMIVLITAAIGTALGYLAQFLLAVLLAAITPFELPGASPRAAILGLMTAVTVAIGFALPHLLQLKVTPPLRVLRKNLSPPPLRSSLVYGVAIAALIVMVWAVVQEVKLLAMIVAGVAGLALVSVLAGWILVRLFTRFRGVGGVAWRYGLANISRRGTESVVQIVAFGLSLMVLLLLTIVRNDLLDNWQQTLPENAPNYFLFNIDPDDWDGMSEIFAAELGRAPDFLPLIRGRMTAINGVALEDRESSNSQGRNFGSREANLTWAAKLPASNRVSAGEWWPEDYDGAMQVSLGQQLADSLGVELGDQLGFTVGGEDILVSVTSFREIAWDSLSPNFHLVFSPGEVRELPQTYLSSLYIGDESNGMLKTLLKEYPSVTLIDLEVTLAQIRDIIDKASAAVQYVFLFTLLAGIVVLLAAIQVTRDERRFESAILHTLGASRRQILKGIAAEFIALGALAGTLAAIGASVVSYFLAQQVFNLDYQIDPLVWVAGLFTGAIIVGLTGTLATRKAVNEPPVAVLRNG